MWRDIALANRDALCSPRSRLPRRARRRSSARCGRATATSLRALFELRSDARRAWGAGAPTTVSARPQRCADARRRSPKAAGTVALPGSKSISNRMLLLAALARGTTDARGDCSKPTTSRGCGRRSARSASRVDRAADQGATRCTARGGPLPEAHAGLFLGNAGLRCAADGARSRFCGGNYAIRRRAAHARAADRRSRRRAASRSALRHSLSRRTPAFRRLRIGDGSARGAGMRVSVRGDVSSQFLTGVAEALPLASGARARSDDVRVTTPLISRPYVDDHAQPDAALRRRRRERGRVDVRRAGRRALPSPARSRRGRCVGGVVFPRRRRARRRPGARHGRGPRLDPGRRRIRRRAGAAGRRRALRRRLDRGAQRRAHRAAARSTARRFPMLR